MSLAERGAPSGTRASVLRGTRRARPVLQATRLSTTVVAAAVARGLLAPSVLGQHQLLVLVVGFLIGLPHGAVDHLVPFWTGWLQRRPRPMLGVLLGYVSVAAVTGAGLYWAGPVVLPLLLVVSVLHFGAGDVMAEHDERPVARPRSRRPSWPGLLVAVLARGAPVVAGPLLAWPDQTMQALAAVRLQVDGPGATARVLLGAVVVACVLWTALVALRAQGRLAAVEVVLLPVLFVALPPLAAFGVYFGAWHGLRHTARLMDRDPRNDADLAAGCLLRPLRRFLVSAALPTLVAGASTTALFAVADHRTDLTGIVFTVLLALTVPHLVMVAILDLSGLRIRFTR